MGSHGFGEEFETWPCHTGLWWEGGIMDEVILQSFLIWAYGVRNSSQGMGLILGVLWVDLCRCGWLRYQSWHGKNGIAWYEQRRICGQWWEGWIAFAGFVAVRYN